ncbi:MAG: hypothetical protein ACK4PR_02295 [Gammaproteobacteria bacterium]
MQWLQKMVWADVRAQVKQVNPVLFNIIEQISPSKKYCLYKIRYPYGQNVTQYGTLMVPDDNGNYSRLDSSHISTDIKTALGYAITPLILQLQKYNEIYFEFMGRTNPLDIFFPGDLYGLFEAISGITGTNIYPTWHVSSGVRSTFMLPNISNQTFHTRMQKKLGYDIPFPQKLSDHWHVFNAIAAQIMTPADWYSEILVFSGDWVDAQTEDANWLQFQKHLLIKSWQQASYRVNRIEMMSMWERFSRQYSAEHLPSYLIDLVKHILAITTGDVPGFIPVLNETEALPAHAIETAYLENYGLKNTLPTIMIPHRMKPESQAPTYFSLSHPTILSEHFHYENPRNILEDLHNVSNLLSSIKKHAAHTKSLAMLNQYNFNCYHAKGDDQQILSLSEIVKHDPTLAKIYAAHPNKQLPCGSKFLTGCVSITK